MNKRTFIGRIPWFLALLGLCFPLIYQLSVFHWVRGLRGFQSPPQRVELSWAHAADNSYQSSVEGGLKHGLRFKAFYIRLNNQLKYNFYNQLNLPEILRGKDGWFFSPFSLNALYGEERVDSARIDQLSQDLRQSMDSLEKAGTSFLFVIAPSKAAIYPEYLPERERPWTDTLPNYYYWKEALKKIDIPLLDTYPLFLKWKEDSTVNAFTKGGFHWSLQAGYRVWDSLYQRIDELVEAEMPRYTYGEPLVTKKGRKADTDLVDASNLFWSSLIDQTYIYPQMNILDYEGQRKPSVMVIGDSFFWNLHAEQFPNRFFAEDFIFWYYFKERYPSGPDYLRKQKGDLKLKEALKGRDIIVYMIFLNNLNDCCWGFVEELHKVMLADSLQDKAG